MKAVLVKVGEKPQEIDYDGTYETLKELVGGYIEYVSVLPGIDIVVNENGIMECEPNRIFYATEQMEQDGYLDSFNGYETVVKANTPYALLHGDFVVLGSAEDEYGDRDHTPLTDEQAEWVKDWFSPIGWAKVGMFMVIERWR